jgi:TonB-linked SusC/RagA family outer membrane protein
MNAKQKRMGILILLLLFAACTYAQQRISVNYKERPLTNVIADLKTKTGYDFIYQKQTLVGARPITLSMSDVTLQEVLDRVFYRTNLEYEIVKKGVIIRPRQKAVQPFRRTIRGVVYDDEGGTLPGANVLIKGTRQGAICDAEGRFSVIVDSRNPILVFSNVGMKEKEMLVTEKTSASVSVILQSDINVLKDVVVTGYQDIQKTKMTGAAVTITADKLNDRYEPNLLNNLEGRVAGLSTYGGKLTIRGTSSLYAEASPLLVVDGLPVEGKIEDLNPYDIESVNVLKDAAATAIYGARASNGIIVITTKNAKEKNKINIDFTTNMTIYEKKNMDYSDNFYMTPSQQVDTESAYYEYYYFNNDGEVSNPIGSTAGYINRGLALSPLQYAYYQLAKGEITRDQLNTTLNKFRNNNYAQDYANNIYRRQILQQYNLSLRSRSDHSSQNLTINYKYDNMGKVNSNQSQFNVNYKGIFDIAKWLTATFTLNGTFGRNRIPNVNVTGPDYTPFSAPAYYSIYDENGDYAWNNNDYNYGNRYIDFEQNSHYRTMRFNPKEDLYHDTTDGRSQNMRYHADLLFKLFQGLTLNTQIVYETMNNSTRRYADAESHIYRAMRNGYTKEEDGVYTYMIPESGGMLKTTNTNGDYWTWRGQLNFDRTFGKHAINALAGLEFRDTKYKGENGLMLGYDDQLQNSSTSLVNFGDLSTLTNSPSFYNGQFRVYEYCYEPYFADSMSPIVETHHRYASGYLTATYTYDERYNAFFSLRKDYADVYGLNAKFRGKPLWSVGMAWNINNEQFMKSMKWVDYLKLRASYGVTGNIYQGATSYMTATLKGNNPYTKLPYAVVESPANPELKWEQTRTTNIGLDFSLLNNRLRGNLDYYHKMGKDLFSYKSLDPSKGFASMFMNMANMKNDGIELQLTYDWFRSSNPDGLSWTTSYTMSYNKNKITKVENASTTCYELVENPYKKGYPSSALWAYRFAGIDSKTNKGCTLWYDSDGNKQHHVQMSSVDALIYAGQSEPKIIMGMDNTWRYKGLSLSILLAYYGGHKMRALAEEETFEVPLTAIPSYFLKAWTPENPTNTPGIGRYSSHSTSAEPDYADIAIRPADFIKIRNLVFGYDLPKAWLEKFGIHHATLKLQIDNPKYLWVKNKVHVDPETLGIRRQSAYIFGLNVNI